MDRLNSYPESRLADSVPQPSGPRTLSEEREPGRNLPCAELVGLLLIFGGHQRQCVGGLLVGHRDRQAAALALLRPEKFGLPAVGYVDQYVHGTAQMAFRVE